MLSDLLGRSIFSQLLGPAATLDVSRVPAGTYGLRVVPRTGAPIHQRVVVVHAP